MGVIYKLKSEIQNFIIEEKKAKPVLSCRGLASLVEEKFQIKLSKSSINDIIKAAGLSMPVGRRLKKRRIKPELPVKPQEEIRLLEAPVEKVPEEPAEAVPAKPVEQPVESLPVEKPPEEIPVEKMPEEPLVAPVQALAEEQISGAVLLKAMDYLVSGPKESNLSSQIESTILAGIGDIPSALQEVRCIKVNLADGSTLYLDGQLHSVWSTPQIPYDFATTICDAKSYINRYFSLGLPLVLFTAPGYDLPSKEFFNFLSSLDSEIRKITRLTLYGNKLDEIESIAMEQAKRRFFIFGFWPWQFTEYRKVNKIGEFQPFNFEPLKKNFYLADIEIALSQGTVGQALTLRGAALKTSLNEKTRLLILTNLPGHVATTDYIAKTYLNHWPNLDEAFQDYSRKIELFTYTASSQRFFSAQGLDFTPSAEVKALLNEYLKALDLYFKWHFLPSGYEERAFSTIKEQFYDLKAVLKRENDQIFVSFLLPPGFAFQKDLAYALRRLNEREICSSDKKRIWFTL